MHGNGDERKGAVQLQLIDLPVAEDHKYAKRNHKRDPEVWWRVVAALSGERVSNTSLICHLVGIKYRIL